MNERQCKIVLIGEESTGKTCLFNRLAYDYFDESITPSLAPACYRKEFFSENTQKVILDLWDTGGQKRLRSLNKIFYKNAQIIVFVYSITNRNSYLEIKDYWIKEVLHICLDIPCI